MIGAARAGLGTARGPSGPRRQAARVSRQFLRSGLPRARAAVSRGALRVGIALLTVLFPKRNICVNESLVEQGSR